ncbi:type II CAAX endopeptidase family protein [Ruminococcus sp.]|uniref:CPBP family intramembrane glutamic endopeptidase n=1 Tax=Ruminococcus sp. TaxID=41978 RepID=UPI002B83323C|nr:type II CAAX endopeptidase family protein [Ruminococcus sp.]HNZ98469.1 type II CAAX endopeptidase family protein [Ruminococcus sp.]HOH85717.1 type II CAAX endopeptidase family protein [Ruminococcus sp.]
MTNKKENIKRLGLYLLIAFALSLLLIVFRKPMETSARASFIITQLFSFSPAIACLITRAATKEGFGDLKLHFNFRGNFRWYLLAFALPLVCFSVSMLLPVIISGYGSRLSGFTAKNVLSVIFILMGQSAVVSAGLLGEELGWRGYMNCTMEPLFGTFGTCLAGGIMWGLWHFPIDISNYLGGGGSLSFSMESAFSRLAMLTCFGVFLMWLTKKTGSIFPAVVAHFMFNQSQNALMSLFMESDIPEDADVGKLADVFGYVPMALVAVVFMYLLLRMKKTKTPSV